MLKGYGVLAAAVLSGAVGSLNTARADLSGGTYTTNSTLTSWPGSPVYTSISAPNGATTAQGFAGVNTSNGNATTILSEVVTPSSTVTLGSIAIVGGGGASSNNAVTLHLYPLSTSTTPESSLASSSSAFYIPGTDMLGAGSGLTFNFSGFSGTQVINFGLTNGPGTNDQVTLAGGTSYAVEFSTVNGSVMVWDRNGGSPADPGGQMMGTTNPTLNSGSRNTIAALGLAGGSPRIAAIALYAVPEPASLGLVVAGSLAMAGRRRR